MEIANPVLVIANFGASSMPANIFLRSHLLRIDKNLHAFVIETVRLAEIEHVETNLNRF